MATLDETKVATFEQVDVMKSRVGLNKAALEGACHCFSIHWCSLQVRSPGGGAKDQMHELGVASGRRNAILQKVFGARWGTDGMEGADFLVLKDNLVESDTTVPYSAYSIDAARHALSGSLSEGAKFGAAFLYSFWFDGAEPAAARIPSRSTAPAWARTGSCTSSIPTSASSCA